VGRTPRRSSGVKLRRRHDLRRVRHRRLGALSRRAATRNRRPSPQQACEGRSVNRIGDRRASTHRRLPKRSCARLRHRRQSPRLADRRRPPACIARSAREPAAVRERALTAAGPVPTSARTVIVQWGDRAKRSNTSPALMRGSERSCSRLRAGRIICGRPAVLRRRSECSDGSPTVRPDRWMSALAVATAPADN